jgi:ABC-type transport system substrate-binding protein
VSPNIEPWKYDPKAAKKLLKDNGYVDSDGDGIWEDLDVWIVNPRVTNCKFSGVNPSFNIVEWDVTE